MDIQEQVIFTALGKIYGHAMEKDLSADQLAKLWKKKDECWRKIQSFVKDIKTIK